jgi:dTDP-4-dehydrorhamnose 3,5-epimerase-like enzyme
MRDEVDMQKFKIIEFKEIGDPRGYLVAIEGSDAIPFEIKRLFWLYGTQKEITRGQHANRNSKFVLICLSGSCKVRCYDGQRDEVFTLSNPHTGLYMDKMVWKDMYDFSENAVLLVLSDCTYDPSEYVRDIRDV